MKYFIAFLFCFFTANATFSQQYRLTYDKEALPELYDQVTIYAQQQKGSNYITLPSGKYKLTTNEGKLNGDILTIDRNKLQHNKGIVNLTLLVQGQSTALQLQLPVLKSIRYNLYTDSIKPVLNFYINIEGEFSSGRVFPLDSSIVTIKADQGTMTGMEWIAPTKLNFEKVTFTTSVKGAPEMSISKTVFIKK